MVSTTVTARSVRRDPVGDHRVLRAPRARRWRDGRSQPQPDRRPPAPERRRRHRRDDDGNLDHVPRPEPAAPTITGLRQARRTWLEGTRPATIARAATGTVFTFDLAAAARVTVTFTGKVAGRRVGGRCVAPTRANRHRSSCTRTREPRTAVVRRPRRGERRELRRAGGTPPARARPVHRPLHREQRPRPGDSRRAYVHDRRLTHLSGTRRER